MEERTDGTAGSERPPGGSFPSSRLEPFLWATALLLAFLWACVRLDVSAVVVRRAAGEAGSAMEVLSREAWSAAPPRRTPADMTAPRWITLHHVGGKVTGEFDRESAARAIRSIQRYHQEERGWNDIAYHFVVDRAGRIWEARPATQVGAHAGSAAANLGNLGVVLLGNLDLQVPSASQLDGLERLLDHLCRAHGIPRGRVCGHDEVRTRAGLGHTRCPGRNLEAWIEEFRRS